MKRKTLETTYSKTYDYGKTPSFLKTKWGLFPVTVLVFSLTFLLSSNIPLERTYAEEIYHGVIEAMSYNNPLEIFIHNLSLSIIMTIPLLGFGFSILSSSSTGLAVSAVSTLVNLNPLSIAVRLISSPFGILEFLAYGLASAQSLSSVFAITEKRMRREVKGYVMTILMLMGFLLTSALLEVLSITGSLT